MNRVEVRVRGRISPQAAHMRVSYRVRGRVARRKINRVAVAQTKIGEIKVKGGRLEGRVNRMVVRVDMVMIERYSAIKIRANLALLYSVLNPETSSDSPSVESNGAREVSATQEISHMIATIGIASVMTTPLFIRVSRVKVFEGRTSRINTRAMAISYDNIWASLRDIPIDENLELDLQLIIKIVYV